MFVTKRKRMKVEYLKKVFKSDLLWLLIDISGNLDESHKVNISVNSDQR